jgi:23S rRNA A1618 N6-methylase RlmF
MLISLRRKADGSWSLDFANPESSRVLAKAVFKTEYGLDVELPKGHLIPTVHYHLD